MMRLRCSVAGLPLINMRTAACSGQPTVPFPVTHTIGSGACFHRRSSAEGPAPRRAAVPASADGIGLRPFCLVTVNVNSVSAASHQEFENSGEPGLRVKGILHLETPLRQLHATNRARSCARRGGHMQPCFIPNGGERNRARDIEKKGSLLR